MKVLDEAHGDEWTLYNGDSAEVITGIPDASVGLTVFSPPFRDLYVYSDSPRDMGNCESPEAFDRRYGILARELLRITKPGRLCCVHCSDLPRQKWKEGVIGISDFPGDLIRIHEAAGWVLHSRVHVWKDPVTEMQRTKALGLLYSAMLADSTRSRVGIGDQVLVFRRWPQSGEETSPVTHSKSDFTVDQWQEWASPMWTTIDQTNTLNARVARGDGDEKHLCPLQLDLIDRCVQLWSNPGDVVFSPFAGIGSELVRAVHLGRRAMGVELKPEYYRHAVMNLRGAGAQMSLFGGVA